MVFGDTINDNNDIEDGEMNDALISGPPVPETCDPEVSCGRSASTAVGAPHGKDSGADAAGQRVGEHSRRGSSALDTWRCAVHRHRTGLHGEVRRPDATGSGGEHDDEDRLLSAAAADEWDPGGGRSARDDDDERRMLADIMSVADRALRLDALRRYLAAAAAADCDRDRPDDAAIAGKGRSATKLFEFWKSSAFVSGYRNF